MKVAKELFADNVKEKKLREPEEKKEFVQALKNILCRSGKERICSMYNKTLLDIQLLDSVFVMPRIIKVEVWVIS